MASYQTAISKNQARLGASSVYTMQESAPVAPVDLSFWLAEPQNIRKYMGGDLGAALAYYNSTLDSIIYYCKTILSGDPKKFDWAQAQYTLDRSSLIAAIQKVISDQYGSNLDSKFSDTVNKINDKLKSIYNDLLPQMMKLNPDIGQANTLQTLYTARYLEAQAANKPLPQQWTFKPGYTSTTNFNFTTQVPQASNVQSIQPQTASQVQTTAPTQVSDESYTRAPISEQTTTTNTSSKSSTIKIALIALGAYLAYRSFN